MLNRLLGLIKKGYVIESKYTAVETLFIVLPRLRQILNGYFFKIIGLHTNGFCFISSGVTISHRHSFRAGKNLIIGKGSSIDALSENGIKLGNNVSLAQNVIIQCTGVIAKKGIGLIIGDNTGINSNVFLGCQGGLEIGSEVIIGPGVSIFTENHNFDLKKVPIKNQGETRKGVVIKNNCWIGAGAIILDGVIIEEGAVVAAGSVVNKNVNKNSLVAGIPAKYIKQRF